MNSERSRRRRRVTWTLLIVGLGCCGAAVYAELRVRHQLTEAKGRVVATHAVRGPDYWHAQVEFEYVLNGVEHRQRESRLLRESFRNEAEALAAIDARPGQPVVVYVDPNHPGAASLTSGANSFRYFAAAGALWMSLALAWFIYDRHERNR